MLADGERLRLQPVYREAEIREGFHLESLVADLPFVEFKMIAEATSVEIAVGLRDAEPDVQQLSAFREMASILSASSDEAERIEGDHLVTLREREEKQQAAMDRAVEKARATSKAGAIDFNGLHVLDDFKPTAMKYGTTIVEIAKLLESYPEFNDAASR